MAGAFEAEPTRAAPRSAAQMPSASFHRAVIALVKRGCAGQCGHAAAAAVPGRSVRSDQTGAVVRWRPLDPHAEAWADGGLTPPRTLGLLHDARPPIREVDVVDALACLSALGRVRDVWCGYYTPRASLVQLTPHMERTWARQRAKRRRAGERW